MKKIVIKMFFVLIFFFTFGSYVFASDYIIYRNNSDGGKLYKKNANDSDNGIPITSVNSSFPTVSPDGQYIVYSNLDDLGKLYRKNVNDSGNGTAINNTFSYFPTYSADGQYIIYINDFDNRKIYRKNANDLGNGSIISEFNSFRPTYSPDGQYIIFSYEGGGGGLYRKNANDNSNGVSIMEGFVMMPLYSPDGNYITYINPNDSLKLYRKNANDNSTGSSITTASTTFHTYSTDGQYIIYVNSSDGGKLYRKNANDSGNGIVINTTSSIFPFYYSEIVYSPTNLTQQITPPESPSLPREQIPLSGKVGKFQSGSGIILSANISNTGSSQVRLAVEVYRLGQTIPMQTLYSNYFNSGTGEVIVPYYILGSGEYFWKARTEVNGGGNSNWVDFHNNYAWEYDFAYFEGIEPYPYGYNFLNASPDFSYLTGSYSYILNPFDGTFSLNKINGSKWEIMDKIFPLSVFNSEQEYFDAFDFLLDYSHPPVFVDGNCFGLSLSALGQYAKPDRIANKFPEFSSNVGTGYVRNNIQVSTSKINNKYIWSGLDDNIKTILSLQLYQYEENYSDLLYNSYNNDTYTGILNKIRDYPNKNYILSFKGKDNCNIFGTGCTFPAHAVVPYKVEGNRIYIWDSNYPYNNENYLSYQRYIEINTSNNTFNIPGYDWDEMDIAIVDLDDIYSGSTTPIGFNQNDIVYSVRGDSDILLIDSNGRKSGYKDGEKYEEIPGVNLLDLYNISGSSNIKQIYLPNKIDGLKIEITSKSKGKYDFLIAGGDYFTKISGIETDSGQIDKFTLDRESLEINFDKRKTGTYDLKINDYKEKRGLSLYKKGINSKNSLQRYSIDGDKVRKNDKNSIKYQIDENGDGNFDKESYIEGNIKNK